MEENSTGVIVCIGKEKHNCQIWSSM